MNSTLEAPSEFTPKHEVAIERSSDEGVTERKEWLAGMWDFSNAQDKEDRSQVLAEWQAALPDMAETIRNFPFGEGVTFALDKALKFGSPDGLRAIENLSKRILEHYSTDPDWSTLPETSRRYVRLIEMTLLMIDARHMEETLEPGELKNSTQELLKKLEHYRESTDIPEKYKTEVIDRALGLFERRNPALDAQQDDAADYDFIPGLVERPKSPDA